MKSETPKRKIVKDRKFPDPEQINRYQDFERLHNDYSIVKKLMLKKSFIWTGLAAGVVAISSVLYISNRNQEPKNDVASNDNPVIETPRIQPPIPGKEMAYSVYRISSAKGAVLHYPTGSSVTIPANAFYHSDGKEVGDSIDVKYREFHTPLDIFLSGIPMEYDSAGLVRTFESAGMIEILASDEGKNLVLKEDKAIDIKMASANKEDRFNLYELDTVKGNWNYNGKDKIEDKSPKPVRAHTRKIQAEVPDQLLRPVLADPQKFHFKITYDENDFPELAAYDNVTFEVTDDSFKPAFYKINWKEIFVVCGEMRGDYVVKLRKADTTISVRAKPVFEKENYEAAMLQFEQKQNTAAKVQETRHDKEEQDLTKVNEELVNYDSRKLVLAAFDNAGISVTFRGFSVRSLGYHNIDYPLSAPLSYAYKITGSAGSAARTVGNPGATYTDIFLVQKGRNAVYRFRKGEPVRCNPEAKNLMWTVTANNQVAFFRITDYSKLVNGGENRIEPVVAQNQDLAFQEIRRFSMR